MALDTTEVDGLFLGFPQTIPTIEKPYAEIKGASNF